MSKLKLPFPLNWIAEILTTLWFIWVALWFLITGLLVFGFYVIIFNILKGKPKINAAFFVTKWWGRLLMFGMGIIARSKGLAKIDRSRNYVLISNHLSMVDIPVCMSACPIPFSFLAKKEADTIPFVGYLARNMHVYVDRKNAESRVKSMEIMKQHLAEKSSILLYAEGTRNKTDKLLQKFHNGAFRLAIEAQSPILVLTVVGSEKAMDPRRPLQARPALPLAVWSDPIETAGLTMADIPKLEEQVKNQMLTILKEYYPNKEA